MTPEQLQEGFYWANHQFYSLPSIWRRLAGTTQRFIPRLEMNREFRKLIKRTCPKGTLSPLATVLKTLQARLPSIERSELIPNALPPIKQMQDSQSVLAPEPWLNIKAKRHDQFAALFVDLEGTLDRLNAQELLKRIREAAEKVRLDIIINFEHLKHATPDALKALLDREALKSMLPHAKVRYRKFRAAFKTSPEEVSLNGLEILREDFPDA
jgi:hypothetical protein